MIKKDPSSVKATESKIRKIKKIEYPKIIGAEEIVKKPEEVTVVINEPTPSMKGPFSVAGAIIVAGVVIAGAIMFTRTPITLHDFNNDTAKEQGTNNQPPAPKAITIKAVTSGDHILGDINAPILIVEYSDLECPYCKRFHSTMHDVVDAYQGKVAWVYRHLPIDSLHPKARLEAEATECAEKIGGNDAFWKYIDKVFAITPSNNQLDLAELPKIAEQIGLSKTAFTTCLNNGTFEAKIAQAIVDGAEAGIDGTPLSFILTKTQSPVMIQGAQSFDYIKQQIDSLLK
ncbi:MAG: DsbA family protein [Candidatus Paceibacterota bacterium]